MKYKRIKDLREDNDLKQQDLADYYKTSVDYLMERTDNPLPYEGKHIK